MSGMPTRYLEQLSVTQRACLGFPPPGNAYWTPHTITAVGLRYAKMDMSPYLLLPTRVDSPRSLCFSLSLCVSMCYIRNDRSRYWNGLQADGTAAAYGPGAKL